MNLELNIPLFDPARSILSRSSAIPQEAENHRKHSCAFGPAPKALPPSMNDPTSLFDAVGRRKYLNADERARFVTTAAMFGARTHALCLLLHFTGCRISEALAMRPAHLDPGEGIVILQTLKQRRRGVFRMLPIPDLLMEELTNIQAANHDPIFGWHRSTAWQNVTAVMRRAEIVGPQATPRGTRHGFGVAAISAGVPVTLVQRWLGHARLETTSIYLAVTGPEERSYAAKLWRKSGITTEQKEPA